MLPVHSYPPDLTRYVLAHWPSDVTLTYSSDVLCDALSMAFQASLTTEEARPTRFRLLLTEPGLLPETGAPNDGVLRLQFDHSRPLTADELRRLSPAAPFETTLIGAHPEDGKLRIWGLAQSGPAWLAPTWGGRSLVPNWTYDPIIHVTGPGQVAVRCAGKLVGGLERGLLVDATMDVFDSDWIPALFAQERERVREQHAAQSNIEIESSLVGIVAQQMLRRAIQLIRGARHGGMLLVLDAGPGQETPLGALHLKYTFRQDEPPRRFRSLFFRIVEQLVAGTSKKSIGWSDFAVDPSPGLEKLEQGIFEISRLIASLSAIDGAVVLNKRFEVLGFGAEVSAELPSPARVWRAIDIEGQERISDPIESVGTRHRAAYRFVQDHPGGLAIVISHDGAVRFVANREGQVVFWEQSVSP